MPTLVITIWVIGYVVSMIVANSYVYVDEFEFGATEDDHQFSLLCANVLTILWPLLLGLGLLWVLFFYVVAPLLHNSLSLPGRLILYIKKRRT